MAKKKNANLITNKSFLGIFIGAIFVLCIIFVVKAYKRTMMPVPQPPIISPGTVNCSKQDIEAVLDLSPGAGNVFGTFTLKNISSRTCQVLGNDFIAVHYATAVNNITISHTGQTQSQPFILSPNQTIYSQVHYPNGPQCSTGVTSTKVTFSYMISPMDTITFKDMNGQSGQLVQTCTLPTDPTEIQIWNISNSPITP